MDFDIFMEVLNHIVTVRCLNFLQQPAADVRHLITEF